VVSNVKYRVSNKQVKILITGINGMLGRYIYRELSANSEYEIYGTGRSDAVFSDLKDYFKGDLCKADFINEISVINYDIVIHCMASFHK